MTIYAKSFIALDGNQRLTGATTAQISPYDHYTCHLCGSALVFHPEWASNRPWFEHTREDLTENRRHHCPYVRPEPKEARWIYMLRRYVSDMLPIVRKANGSCSGCNSDYHGERYCLNCRTGGYSIEVNADQPLIFFTASSYWIACPNGLQREELYHANSEMLSGEQYP